MPLSQGASADCEYVFWTGAGARDGDIKTVDRTLKAVFQQSGVRNAHAHSFRHALATETLIKGGSIEDYANILGDSPEIIRKHYVKGLRSISSARSMSWAGFRAGIRHLKLLPRTSSIN